MATYNQYNNSSGITSQALNLFKSNCPVFERAICFQSGQNEYVMLVGGRLNETAFNGTVYRVYRASTSTNFTVQKIENTSINYTVSNPLSVYTNIPNGQYLSIQSDFISYYIMLLCGALCVLKILQSLFKGVLRWHTR